MSTTIAGPSGPQLSSSSRVHSTRTGRPGTARASRTASYAASSARVVPVAAGALHVPDDDVVLAELLQARDRRPQLVDALRVRPDRERPPSQTASPQDGAIEACARYGRVNRARTERAAGGASPPVSLSTVSSRGRGDEEVAELAFRREGVLLGPDAAGAQRGQCAQRVLLALGDDAEEGAVPDDGDHAGDRPGRGVVEGLEDGAPRRRPQDAPVQHAVQAQVVEEPRPAGDLVRHVESRHRPSDDAVRRGASSGRRRARRPDPGRGRGPSSSCGGRPARRTRRPRPSSPRPAPAAALRPSPGPAPAPARTPPAGRARSAARRDCPRCRTRRGWRRSTRPPCRRAPGRRRARRRRSGRAR